MPMAKLGSGKRFAHLEHQLAGRGARKPAALAAFIGRNKYGAKAFGALAHKSDGGEVESDDDDTTDVSGAAKSPDDERGHVVCQHCGGSTPGYADGGAVGMPPETRTGPERKMMDRDSAIRSSFAKAVRRGM